MIIKVHEFLLKMQDEENITKLLEHLNGHKHIVNPKNPDICINVWVNHDKDSNIYYGCLFNKTGSKSELKVSNEENSFEFFNFERHNFNYFIINSESKLGMYLTYHGSVTLNAFSKMLDKVSVSKNLIEKDDNVIMMKNDPTSIEEFISEIFDEIKIVTVTATDDLFAERVMNGLSARDVSYNIIEQGRGIIRAIIDEYKGRKPRITGKTGKKRKTINIEAPSIFKTFKEINLNEFVEESKKYCNRTNFHLNGYLQDLALET